MRLRVKEGADKVRALEKAIAEDFIAGMTVSALVDKYHFSKQRIVDKINAHMLHRHEEE